MSFKSYAEVINAFNAGAKFAVVRPNQPTREVTGIDAYGVGMRVRTQGGGSWVGFSPDGTNRMNSQARLVLTSQPQPRPLPADVRYFVALVENGVPKFSESPVPHPSHEIAGREADRLAAKFPGKTFKVYAERIGASFVAPKPKTILYRVEARRHRTGLVEFRAGPKTEMRDPRPVGYVYLGGAEVVFAQEFEVQA